MSDVKKEQCKKKFNYPKHLINNNIRHSGLKIYFTKKIWPQVWKQG